MLQVYADQIAVILPLCRIKMQNVKAEARLDDIVGFSAIAGYHGVTGLIAAEQRRRKHGCESHVSVRMIEKRQDDVQRFRIADLTDRHKQVMHQVYVVVTLTADAHIL